MNRNKTLDMLKGIAIFLVVLGHATFVNDKLITYIFSFHMPLFFIVSGMLMCMNSSSDISFLAFVKKKLRSIALPYLCFSIIYTIIDFLSVYYQQISLQDLKINAVCTISLAGSGPLWFLPTLFLAEIILFLLCGKLLKDNSSLSGRMIFAVLGIIIGIIGMTGCYCFEPFFTAHKESLVAMFFMNFVVVILRAMLCQIFMVPGYLLYKLSLKLKQSFSIMQLICGIILMVINIPLALKNVNIDLHNMNYGNPFLFVICAFLGTIGLYLIVNNLPALRLISFWGRNSLVIMIVHLNFYYLYAGNLLATFLNTYITRAKSYLFLFNILWVAMLLSSLTVLLINRFVPWMVGKKKNPLAKS